jgi:UDP-N-acetyl-D-galactosamine dehydrogenase
MSSQGTPNIAIIGLGYVGLPLAVEFGKIFNCIGFDINQQRIDELEQGMDSTLEITKEDLSNANKLTFSSNSTDLKNCNIYIITVPTPIDQSKRPDLTPLIKASALVGSVISKNDIIIYESTVYPGCTEEVCLPVVEEKSGLVFNKDFLPAIALNASTPETRNAELPISLK